MPLKPPGETHQTLLAETLDITRCLQRRGDSSQKNEAFYQRQQLRLKALQAELGRWRRHAITDQPKPVETIPMPVRRAFVQAALSVSRYRQLAGHQWRGTLPSPTLSKQVPDGIPAGLESESAISALCHHFQLPSQEHTRLTATLQQIDQRIASQTATIQAVLSSVGLEDVSPTGGTQLSRIQAAFLFKHLFGITLPAQVVDIVYTPLQIYFCLSANQAKLATEVPVAERQRLNQLFESMQTFSFKQFGRFPTFGPCQPKFIDTAWVNSIAQQLDTSANTVIQALSSSVGILPTDKAETFLIHDIWGHYWQLMMTQFQADYAILARCDAPLQAGETAYTDEGPVTCRELFHLAAEEVTLDENKAHAFFHGEVRQRLGLVFTHLMGEMMADVAEFKFVWCNPQSVNELPSSSVFKTEPVKLDLSLIDLDFLFVRVINSLMEINVSALNTSPLEQEILSSWKEEGIKPLSLELKAHLKQRLSRLHEIFLDDYRQHYLPSLKSSAGIFSQAVTNLIYLQNTINYLCVEACRELTAELVHNSLEPPLYHDLLMIFIGCFCSGDGYSNFWQMDAVLADYFLPCWHLLRLQQTDPDIEAVLSNREKPYAR